MRIGGQMRTVGVVVWLAALMAGCGSEEPPKKDLCSGELAERFAAQLGGTQDEVAFGVARASDGGYALAGRSDSLETGPNRGWLARTDKYGRFQWGVDLGPTAGGADVLALDGGDWLTVHGAFQAARIDDTGAITWQTSWDDHGGKGVEAFAAAPGKGGGALLAGTRFTASGTITASRDAVLMRIADGGQKLWHQTYTKDALTQAQDVLALSDGALVVGWTEGKVGATGRDMWALKTDGDGNPVWSERFGGNFDEEARAAAPAPGGGWVLAGMTRSFGAGDLDMWLVGISPQGKQVWAKTHGADESDEGYGIARVGDHFITTGRRNSLGLGPGGMWLLEVDAAGEAVWQMTYGAAYKGLGHAVLTLPDGFAVAGASSRNSKGGNDFWLVRANREGRHKCPGALCYGKGDLSCGIGLSCDAEADPPVCEKAE